MMTHIRKHSFLHVITLLVLGGILCLQTADADSQAYASEGAAKEYRVKAAFLYNFIRFTTWPGDKATSKTHQVNICVIGESPFEGALDAFKKASTTSLAFDVKEGISMQEIPACHVLFVSASEKSHVDSIIARARGNSVLTVSEIEGFADKGGVIEMVKVEKNVGLFSKDKINLRVNMQAAADAPLDIDAQLLEIAAEVLQKH